jgi:hypothetical protein
LSETNDAGEEVIHTEVTSIDFDKTSDNKYMSRL